MTWPMPSLSRCAVALLVGVLATACHDLDEIVGPSGRCQPGFIRVGNSCLAEPPSCADMPRTCGPARNSSCCAFDLIPASSDANNGLFDRSWDRSGQSDQEGQKVTGFQMKGAATAIVSAFYLDRYEVTVGRFRKLYAVWNEWLQNNPLPGAGNYARSTKGGWRFSWRQPDIFATEKSALELAISDCEPAVRAALDDNSGAHDHQPMTCINWFEAYLFCIFDGGRLPTEAEWNFAATGGSQQRAYPWSPPEGDGLVMGDDYANVGAPAGALRLFDVGHYPKGVGRYGQYDLAGNAIEWVYDRCGDCESYRTKGETDPIEIDIMGDVNVVARGGSFRFGWRNARTAFRQRVAADVTGRWGDTGWRCARNM
jgi:formylglycine-generating enzyme